MEEPLKILMLEDTQDDVGLIQRMLRKQGVAFVAHQVDTEEDFTTALHSFSPDVILSDHALPQFNSLEALQICKDAGMNVPFILVTGTVSEEFAVSCLKQGADDYVLKSNLVRLPSAIQNALRQRIQENKRQHAERALREQNEELTKINKELDSFVYSVSHNLRAPLMSVLGLLNLVQIENQEKDLALEAYFSMMQNSIHKLDETLREILDYSRNARSDLNIEPVDMRKLIDESFEKLKYLEGWDRIEKRITVEENAPFLTDAYRISLILNNFVSNAIKYHDRNKNDCRIEIHVTVNEHALSLRFQDNGIGISENLIGRIFDMFFRATERSEGAGLGLYIVKETIDKLGGSMEVSSELGNGTTFLVRLPNQPMSVWTEGLAKKNVTIS